MKTLLFLLPLTFALAAPARQFFVYFGTYTNALSQGIYVSRLESGTGRLSAPELAAETPNPSFLAIAPTGKFLYAANEVSSFGDEKAGMVSALAIDQKTGRQALINQESSGGAGPCHLSTDATGAALLVANYDAGSVKSFRLRDDGGVGAEGSLIHHHGASVNASRQTGPHAHCIIPDPANRFALACDLGTDQVGVYRLDPAAGTLADVSVATLPPGSGPRHLAFSDDGKFVHVLNEMGCTLSTFGWDSRAGKMAPVETVSALPPDVAVQPGFTAAEIIVSGKFVYVTIRGHDSVGVFSTDARTGRLQYLQNLPTGGKVPRGLGVDPTGHWLLVGNQNSHTVTEFAINQRTGLLAPTGQALNIGSPVDVKFVDCRP
jgi:6-phosphogluconolactonase